MSDWDKCRDKYSKLTDDELRVIVTAFTTPGKAKVMTRMQMIDKIVFWECKGVAFTK